VSTAVHVRHNKEIFDAVKYPRERLAGVVAAELRNAGGPRRNRRDGRFYAGGFESPESHFPRTRLGSARSASAFGNDAQPSWRDIPDEISPDLPLTRERYFHKAATRSDSIFNFAIADTELDG
jgi:hypothetical protein